MMVVNNLSALRSIGYKNFYASIFPFGITARIRAVEAITIIIMIGFRATSLAMFTPIVHDLLLWVGKFNLINPLLNESQFKFAIVQYDAQPSPEDCQAR